MGTSTSRPAFLYRSPRILVICHQCHQLGLKQTIASNLSMRPSDAPRVGGYFSPYQIVGDLDQSLLNRNSISLMNYGSTIPNQSFESPTSMNSYGSYYITPNEFALQTQMPRYETLAQFNVPIVSFIPIVRAPASVQVPAGNGGD